MIKIIGGKYKGKKLNNFKLESLRPTKAIVRKSIMDTLMPFENKNILDLFSGVGTLGIEALSRGAKSAYFVDKNPKAIRILKENINILKDECDTAIQLSDVFLFLKKNNLKFDIIFADPPYHKYDFNDLIPLIKPLLMNDGIFCYESNRFSIKKSENIKVKKYGATQVVFWRKNEK